MRGELDENAECAPKDLVYVHCLECIIDPETNQLSADEASDTQEGFISPAHQQQVWEERRSKAKDHEEASEREETEKDVKDLKMVVETHTDTQYQCVI